MTTAIWIAIAAVAAVVVVVGGMYLYWLHVEAAAKVDLLVDKMAAELKRLGSRCDRLYGDCADQRRDLIRFSLAAADSETELRCNISLILDHLELESQPVKTTPRRLVPKVQQGGEGC